MLFRSREYWQLTEFFNILNAIGDAATLPDLLAQIPTDEQITMVGGDGAYDTRKCRAAIAAQGADAVIPVRRGGQP